MQHDGVIMEEIVWGLDVWGSKRILEGDGVEVFGSFLGRFLEEYGVEAFGSLNANFEVFSIFKSFKKDLGIHIALDFSFPLDALECISSMMDLGANIFFDLALWVVDLCGLLNNYSFFSFTYQLDGT